MSELLYAISLKNKQTKKELESVLNETLDSDIHLFYLNDLTFYFYEDNNLASILKSAIDLIREDFNIDLSILIAHTLSPIVEFFLTHKEYITKNEFSYLYEIILKNYSKKDEFVQLIKSEFKDINQISLESADSYIEHDLNVLKTSEALGIHRNTLNYRLESFYNETNLDLRVLSNAIYFKLFKML